MRNLLKAFQALNKNIRLYIIADGFYYAGYSVVDAFLSVLITIKIAPGRVDLVGFVIGYYMFVRAISEIPMSRLTRKLTPVQKRNLVSASYLLYGGLIIAMGFADSLVQVFAIQTIVGLLDAVAYPLKWPLFVKSVDKEEELAWSLEDIAATILPAGFTILAGSLAGAFGLSAPFILFGMLLLTSGVIFRFLRPHAINNIETVVTPTQIKILRDLVSNLNKMQIPFHVSGGLAAIIYGARNRPLFDIDIDVSKKDLLKIEKFFKKYVVEPLHPYKDSQFEIWLMTLEIGGVRIDFTQAENMCLVSPTGEKRCENINLTIAESHMLFDIKIPVENKKNVVEYKKFIARETDLKDVEEIETS